MSAQGGCWVPLDSETLNRFLEDKVKVRRADTSRALRGALSKVEPILQRVHLLDPRFGPEFQRSSSYDEGPDQLDLLVPVDGLPPLSVVPLWDLRRFPLPPPDASFLAVTEDSWAVALPSAAGAGPQGPSFVSLLPSLPPHWSAPPPGAPSIMDLHWTPSEFSQEMVKRMLEPLGSSSLYRPKTVTGRFKKHVRDVTGSRPGSVVVQPLQQGTPAVTLTVTYHGKEISVTLMPFIEKPFITWDINWPRGVKGWPSYEKTQEIKNTGVDLVAEHNLYWRYSFSRIERVLLKKIDEDGGHRRDSLRILNKVMEDLWKPRFGKMLVSYHLKTVLFWACEKHPSPSDWDDLATSFARLVDYLVSYLKKGSLSHYFLGPSVNLFKPEHCSHLHELVHDVIKFRASPMTYFLSDV